MLGGPGADFLRRVAFWCIRPLGLPRWFCVTGAALSMTWQAHYFRQMEWKIAKRTGMRPPALLNFPFWKEVSRNGFVFDAVNSENWGSLADLLRFWHCQVQKLGKSRRIASFSSLQIDRSIDRPLQLQPRYYYNCNYKYVCLYTTLNYTTQIALHYAKQITVYYTSYIASTTTTPNAATTSTTTTLQYTTLH